MSEAIAEKKEVTEERQRKYWYLSDFFQHVKFMAEHHHEACKAEIINKFLDSKEYEENAYKQMADWDEEVWRHNDRLLRAIKKVKGATFHKYLLEIIRECDRVTDKMTIEKEPDGDWQEERYGRTIKGIWLDQWSTGTEGDSFSGYVWVQLKENKYLKISYSM